MNIRKFFIGRVIGFIVILAVLGLVWIGSLAHHPPSVSETGDYKNIAYTIDGQLTTLHGGVSEEVAAPGSASKITTKYFGNEVHTDLNGDGIDDIAFILTQTTGGSGEFFYVVAAIKTDHGYVGSDAYLLGDRIAPQSTEVSPNPQQKNVIVVNYADRAKGDPMTTSPSVGKSVYLKLDPTSMQWGIVEANFQGESR